jgi:subtilisin-like proprotein convertase family protein
VYRQNHAQLFLLYLLISSSLVGCGGSSDNRSSVQPVTNFGQSPDLGDLGDLTDPADLVDLVNPDNSTVPNNGLQTPSVRTLRWPDDFPADIGAGLTDAIFVTGLPMQSAYNFDVTLPPSVDSDETVLFVMNLSEDRQVGGQVCSGEPDCTGTVFYPTVTLQLVSFDSGAASIAVTPSPTLPLINQGTAADPFELTLDEDQMLFEGSIGAATQTQQQIIQGQSFYQISGLLAGSRYEVDLLTEGDGNVDMTAAYAGAVDAQCDPSYSGSNRCVLVAQSKPILLQVNGNVSLFGTRYFIKVNRLAQTSDFEGTWHTPTEVAAPDSDLVYHFGHADQYSSYYRINGLDPERRYRIALTGNVNPAYLKLNSQTTSLAIGSTQCRSLDDEKRTSDQVCVVEGESAAYFRVEALAEPSQYLLSVEASVPDEGTAAMPLSLSLDDRARLMHSGTVNSGSYYRIEGLSDGSTYLLQVNSRTSRLEYSVYSDLAEEVDCHRSYYPDCVFTAAESELKVNVTYALSDIGQQFLLSIVPTDPTDTIYPNPVNETVALDSALLPYTGTVGGYFSNYTVSNLSPAEMYLATISRNSESMSFAAWPGKSQTINCMVQADQVDGTGCLIRADSEGSINIRVGGDSGGQFTIDLIEAEVRGDYQSNDTPMTIPDNAEPGAVSAIHISDSRAVEVVEVELQVEHGYTEDLQIILEAPNGQRVKLADHVPGTNFGKTVYSDLAALPNNGVGSFASHVLKSYRPHSPLFVLKGIDSSGSWRLHVVDDRDTNRSDAIGGVLHGWGLRLRALAD